MVSKEKYILWDEGDLRYIRNYYSMLDKTIKYWVNPCWRVYSNSLIKVSRNHPRFLFLHYDDFCIRSYSLYNYMNKELLLLLLKFYLESENVE